MLRIRHIEQWRFLLASAAWLIGLAGAGQVTVGAETVDYAWVPIGPFGTPQRNGDVYSGQVNAIAIHPKDADLVFAGASEGGVWRSEDGGKTWFPIADGMLVRDLPSGGRKGTLAIGSLALNAGAKGDPYTIYAGTGNPNVACCGGGLTGPGLGVFRSDDGGLTWAPVGADLTRTGNRLMSEATVYRLLVRTNGHPLIYAATDRGVFLSIESGGPDDWTQLGGLPGDAVSDLLSAGECLFAAVRGQGVYRTCALGSPFQRVSGGLPPVEERLSPGGGTSSVIRIGRIALAASDRVLYAGYESPVMTAAFQSDTTYRLYRSDDGGDNWRQLPTLPRQGQLDFNNTLAISPHNAEIIYAGQVSLVRAVDGGISGRWTQLSCCAGDGNLQRAGIDLHADLHGIVFAESGSFAENPSDAEIVYVATDGGVARGVINDVGAVFWQPASTGLAIGQCGTMDISGASALSSICGLWHNGNVRTADGGKEWLQVHGGDGFQTTLDAGDPTTAYFNCNAAFGGSICRSRTDSGHALPIALIDTIWAEESNVAHWSDPFNPGHLLRLQGGQLFRTVSANNASAEELQRPELWQMIEPPGKAGKTTTVAFAPPDRDSPRYFLGTDAGDVWFGSPEVGWQRVCGCGEPVRSIAVGGPSGPLAGFAVIGAAGTRGQAHQLIATTEGPWANLRIDQEFTPDVQLTILNVVADPLALNPVIFLGTTQGIYLGEASPSGEWTWKRSRGVPHVAVTDLVAHGGPAGTSGAVRASTFGRGIFELVFLVHADLPATLDVRAVEAGFAKRELPVEVQVTAPDGKSMRRPPFELIFAPGSEVTLEARARMTAGTQRLAFAGWQIDGKSQPGRRITLTLPEGATTAVARYAPASDARVLAVIASTAGEDGAPRDPGVAVEVLTGGAEEMTTPFELDLAEGGSVTLRAPDEVEGEEEPLSFLEWELPDGSFDSNPVITLSVAQRSLAKATYQRGLEPRIGSGRLAGFVDASAQTLDPSAGRFRVRVSWVVSGGRPPIAARIEVEAPDGRIQEVRDLPLAGDVKVTIEGKPGKWAKVILTATDSAGASSRARVQAKLPL